MVALRIQLNAYSYGSYDIMMISFVSFYVSFVEFFILNFSVYMSIDFMHFFYLTSIILNFFTFTIWLADKGKMTMYHELTKYLIVRHFK